MRLKIHISQLIILFCFWVSLTACEKGNSNSRKNSEPEADSNSSTRDTTDHPLASELQCSVESEDSAFKDCFCTEYIKGSHQRVSDGRFFIDKTTKKPYRYGWHNYYDQDGQLRWRCHHHVLGEGNTTKENTSEYIEFDKNGDTIYDKSKYFDVLIPDTVIEGTAFSANIVLHCPPHTAQIKYWLWINEFKETSMNSAEKSSHSFSYTFLLNKPGKFHFSGLFVEYEEIPGTESLTVSELHLTRTFYVRKK